MSFEIYDGTANSHACDASLGNITDLVRKLCSCLKPNHNHHIIMDNYYSSVPLFLSLLKDGHVCTGTVRNNRTGLPRDLLEMKLQRYEFASRVSVPHIAVTSWMDSCSVLLLSTAVPPEQTARLVTAQAKAAARRDGTTPQEIEVPKVVQTYRELMGAVDRHDQVCFI